MARPAFTLVDKLVYTTLAAGGAYSAWQLYSMATDIPTPVHQSVVLASRSAALKAALGEPVKAPFKFMWDGRITSESGSFHLPVQGPLGKGELYAHMVRPAGTAAGQDWAVLTAEVHVHSSSAVAPPAAPQDKDGASFPAGVVAIIDLLADKPLRPEDMDVGGAKPGAPGWHIVPREKA